MVALVNTDTFVADALRSIVTIEEVSFTAETIDTTTYGDRWKTATPTGRVTLEVVGYLDARKGVVPILPEAERLKKKVEEQAKRIKYLEGVIRDAASLDRDTAAVLDIHALSLKAVVS